MELRRREQHKKKHGLDLLIIDYLQFIKSSKSGDRYSEVSEISRSLKNMAKTLDIPVIVLSSINRDFEKRSNKRPILSDLRDSGNIEYDAHMVIFLYNEWFYKKEAEKGKSEVLVRKNRSGPTGHFFLMFDFEHCRFQNYVGGNEPNW